MVSLVVPRTEEQISSPISSKKIKRPSISGWEGLSYCPKYSKLCCDQFGGWLGKSNNPPPLQPPKVSGLLSRNLAGKCCCNCHKYFSLTKFIFVCLILIIFPCVHAFLALLTNLASRKLAETAALTLIFLACHIIIFTI